MDLKTASNYRCQQKISWYNPEYTKIVPSFKGDSSWNRREGDADEVKAMLRAFGIQISILSQYILTILKEPNKMFENYNLASTKF